MNSDKWPILRRSLAMALVGSWFSLTAINALSADCDPKKSLCGKLVLEIDVPTLELKAAKFNGDTIPLKNCNLCAPGVPLAECAKEAGVCILPSTRSRALGLVEYGESSPGCVTIIWGGMQITYPPGCK